MKENKWMEVDLPEGKRIFGLNRWEVEDCYRDVQGYFKRGIGLKAGDTVIDAGANVGIFSMAAASLVGPSGKVVAFEPIPRTFEVLRENFLRHGAKNMVAVPSGLSSEEGSIDFSFYPNATVLTTAYPEGWRESLAAALILNPDQMASGRWIFSSLPVWLRKLVVPGLVKNFMTSRTIRCPITTVSAAIAAYGLERVDLLKIDVEKSEMNVLRGVNEKDWPKIRQIVAEVHDETAFVSLLEGRGFGIEIDEDPKFKSSKIVNVYAKRI